MINAATQKQESAESQAQQKTANALMPSPCLLVIDEAHSLAKSDSKTSRALSMIKSKKRIGLTGTPFQNSLKEYYSMVNFVAPKRLRTEQEFHRQFVEPIEAGQVTLPQSL